jgi:CRISPR-associated protein Cas2
MRLICSFDLPCVTEKEIKEAKKFREFLLKKGFIMLQWSIYSKHLLNNDNIRHLKESIQNNLPEKGSLILIEMTDKQFESIAIYDNYQRTRPPRKYYGLELF